MGEQPERTSPPPALPVRVIGKALTTMVGRAPWTWPLMRRLVRGFFDRSAGGWDERVRPDTPQHLAALAAAAAALARRRRSIPRSGPCTRAFATVV